MALHIPIASHFLNFRKTIHRVNRTLLIALFVFFHLTGFCQATIDSLIQILDKETDPVRQIELNVAIADEIGYNDTERAFKYALKGYNLAKETGQVALVVRAGESVVNLGAIGSDFELATKVGLELIEIIEANPELHAAPIYNVMGLLYQSREEFKTSLEYFKKAAVAYEGTKLQRGDSIRWSTSLNNLGNAYYFVKDYQRAREYHQKAYQLRLGLGNKSAIADCLNDIGLDYLADGDTLAGIAKFEESYQLKKEIGDLEGMGISKANIGVMQRKLGDHAAAVDAFREVIEISHQTGSIRMLKDIYRMMAASFEELGMIDSALLAINNHMLYKDSLVGIERQKAILDMETKYATSKKELENEFLRKENDQKDKTIQAEQTSKQLLWTAIGLIGAVVVLLVIFSISKVRSNRQITSQKEEVEKQKDIVQEKNNEILDSISYAKRIQSAILPTDKLVKDHLKDSFILYKPKDIVAGDFYWLEPQNNRVLFAACDCTGHGVPGAMVSVVCNNGLNRAVREYGLTNPAEILEKTRDIIVQEFEQSDEDVRDGMDVALCSLEGNMLKYAGANNPLWVIKNNGTGVEEIKADKQPIGKFEASKPYTMHTLELSPGDTIYVFSDGFADQFGGERGKKFKAANFKKLLYSIRKLSMREQLAAIETAFEDWRGELEQLDDVCVIGVRI